jgi:hypothetical protein
MKTRMITVLLFFLFLGNTIAFAQKSEDRKLSAFTDITLRMGAKVHLAQGDNQMVTVKSDQSTLEKLITEVKDRKLVIRFKMESPFGKQAQYAPVEIFITIPQIDKLTIIGSGSITADDAVESRILDMTLSGSGEINLADLKTDKVSVILSGSGVINLAGKEPASEFKAVISGSGNVKAADFSANDANVKIAGSGNCWITANKNLTARIAGSGNVYYKGNPAIDTSTTGSGKVQKDSLR